MSIFTKSRTFNKEDLRKFGCGLGAIVLVVCGIINPFIFKKEPNFWIIGMTSLFSILVYLFPYKFKHLFILIFKVTSIVGVINQYLLLSSIFYFILCPIHLILWIFRYDSMQRRFNEKLKSYRVINKRRINIEEPF